MALMSEDNVQKLFGSIDIYLFDQLLKGRLTPLDLWHVCIDRKS
jgi:hypothetical protein